MLTWAQTEYVIQKGDTILKIADKNIGTTDKKDPRRYDFARKIQKLNPNIKNMNQLEPGKILLIPNKDKPVFVDIKKPSMPEARTHSKPTSEDGTTKRIEPLPMALKENSHNQVMNEDQEHHPNFILIQPRYQLLHLEAKNLTTRTDATMKSKNSYGLDIQYGKIINDQFHLLFQVGLSKTDFTEIEGDATSVNHTSETTKSFGLGVAYEVSQNLNIDFIIFYADRTFLVPDTSGAYKLESLGIPGAELNISWNFYSNPSNFFGISAIGEYVGNYTKDDIDYKSALEPLGAIYWKSNYGIDHTNYKATLTYKHGHLKTNVSEQSEEISTGGLGFYF